MIVVNAYMCQICKCIIYSRVRHDFHWCPCGNSGIDGGFDYSKVSYKKNPPKPIQVTVNATKKELFDDWDRGINKYGVIGGEGNIDQYAGHNFNEDNTEIKISIFMVSYELEKDEWIAFPVNYSSLEDLKKDFNNIAKDHFLHHRKMGFEFIMDSRKFDSRDFYRYDSVSGELKYDSPNIESLENWVDGRIFVQYKTRSSVERNR